MRVLYLHASGRRRFLELDCLWDDLALLMRCTLADMQVRPIDARHYLVYCTAYPQQQNLAIHRLHWDLCFTGGDACVVRADGSDVARNYSPFRYPVDISPYSFWERLLLHGQPSLFHHSIPSLLEPYEAEGINLEPTRGEEATTGGEGYEAQV